MFSCTFYISLFLAMEMVHLGRAVLPERVNAAHFTDGAYYKHHVSWQKECIFKLVGGALFMSAYFGLNGV